LKQKTGTPYELDEIWQTWYLVYRRHYFKTALENAGNIKKQFYHYQETNELQVYIQKFNIIYVCVIKSKNKLMIYNVSNKVNIYITFL